MKKKLLFIGLLCLAVAAPAGKAEAGTHPFLKFRIKYPKNWSMTRSDDYVAIVSTLDDLGDTFRENVGIRWENFGGKTMTLEAYRKLSYANAKSVMPGYRLVEEGDAEISGRRAYYTVWTGYPDGLSLKFKAYTFLNDDASAACTLIFTSERNQYDKYLPQAEEIMDSFKLVA